MYDEIGFKGDVMACRLDDILFSLRNIFNGVFGIIFGISFLLYGPFFLYFMIYNSFYGAITVIFFPWLLPLIVVVTSSCIIKTKTPSFPQIMLGFLVVILSVIGLFNVGIPYSYRMVDFASIINILVDRPNMLDFFYFVFCTAVFSLYTIRGILGHVLRAESRAE
jgi:uncharacterized membrane protein